VFNRLPEYPWESLKPYAAKAAQHSGGKIDFSVGSPVDPLHKLFKTRWTQPLTLLATRRRLDLQSFALPWWSGLLVDGEYTN